ncbi:MAG: 16S rRNA (adenine(1518)-N(6)/adenine(1519)-N(6))-dimethyltransferase RsmA [Candidatus Bathyarchaeia archaeon]
MTWIRKELENLRIHPLKRFGQHFLVDEKVRDAMVSVAQPSRGDRILEIGPGLGYVTTELLKHNCQIIAIEKDHTLAPYLRNRFSDFHNLTILEGDALKMGKMDCNKIVSSPPYNISSKLILFVILNQFDRAVFLLQTEFIHRLTAKCGSHEYGRLTVTLQSKAEANFIMKVPRTAFYPMPKVDSGVVTITPRKDPLTIENSLLFEDLVRFLFTQRRRKLRGVLTRYLRKRVPTKTDSILSQITFLERRIFQISPTELADLSNQVAYKENELGSSIAS